MKKEKCEHELFRPIAYSDGQHFVDNEEVFTTPYSIVKCGDCSLVALGWVEEIES